MPSTMETFAKMMGAKAVIGGGIEKMNKILSGEAKMERNLKKRQAQESKEAKKLMIAEELETHKNWLREHGSLIQAIKDDASGYATMGREQREAVDSENIERVKAKILRKKLHKQERASVISGIETTDWARQAEYNEAIARKRQAEKDLKKRIKGQEKANELRIAELAEKLRHLGEFQKLDKDEIIEKIKSKELIVKNNELQEETLKAQEEYLGIKRADTEDAGGEDGEPLTPTTPTTPTIGPENVGLGDSPALSSIGNNEDIIAAIDTGFEQQDQLLIRGLGLASPPFLQTLTKIAESGDIQKVSIEGENIGMESAPDTNGVNGSELNGPEVITAEDPLPIESENINQLLEIEKEKLGLDKDRAAREIKAQGIALEARRDKGKLVEKKGAPTLNKVAPQKGGGLLSMLGSIFMSPLGRIGTAIASLTGATTLLTGATGLLSTATSSLGNFANKLLPNWMKKMLPAPGSPTTGGAPKLTKAGKVDGRGQSPGSKAQRFQKGWNKVPVDKTVTKTGQETLKHTKGISKLAGKSTKLLGRAAIPLTIALEAFNMYSTEQREDLDRTDKNIKHAESVGGVGGAVGGSMAGAAIGTAIFPGVGTVIGGLIGGGLGYFLGGEISKTVAEEVSDKTDLATGEDRFGELPESDQKLLMREAEKQGAVDVGLGHGTIDDLEKLSKLDLSTIESLLDQETWEKEDKDQLIKLREAKKAGREVKVKKGSFWAGTDDEILAGEKGSAGPSVNVEEKLKKLRKEKKAMGRGFQSSSDKGKLSPEASDAIARVREQEEKEREELQARPDSELSQSEKRKKYNIKGRFTQAKVRMAKKRMALKKKAQQLKDSGRTKGTFKGGVLVPEKGDQQQLSADDQIEQADEKNEELQRQLASGEITQEQYTQQRYGMSQEQRTAAAQQLGGPGATGTTTVDKEPVEVISNALTEEGLIRSTPDVEKADSANKAMLDTGSIFTHDTHLEKTLWDIWAEEKSFFDPKTLNASTVDVEGEKELPLTEADAITDAEFAPQLNMFGNQPDLMAPVPVIDVSPNAPEMGATVGTIPSGMLEQSLITKMMEMQKQVDTAGAGGGNQMISAPTINNNETTQMIQSASTAHAGVIKPGTGRG